MEGNVKNDDQDPKGNMDERGCLRMTTYQKWLIGHMVKVSYATRKLS